METNQKTSSTSQALLWFGAAVSISEIVTGALIAPLGLKLGLLAIFVGHVIGFFLLYFTGLIGAKSGLSAIESTRISFGKYGSYLFSVLNVLQLLGWTAVMIANGAAALAAVTGQSFGFGGQWLWCVVIGALIALWIVIGIKNLTVVNIVAVGGLFVLSVILGWIVFRGQAGAPAMAEGISFGAAVELSVVMPLSWIPLISDYTRHVRRPQAGTLASAGGYFIGGCLMYSIGLGAAIYAGTSDIAQVLIKAGLSVAALLIVALSTVTTTFLDAYSAGVSAGNLSKKINEKYAALVVCGLGVLLAVFVPMSRYETFLSLIGSVFAPLFAILLTDYFVLRHHEVDVKRLCHVPYLVLWVVGVIGYHLLNQIATPVGITLPVMVGIGILTVLVEKGREACLK